MAKRKTKFDIVKYGTDKVTGMVRIVIANGKPTACFQSPKVSASPVGGVIQGKDLELFALNILKALKSKHLKQ